MARRKVDTSKAKCDTCGKLYQEGDAVYGLADKFDEEIEDRDVLISFRHWDCHTPTDVLLKQMRESVASATKKAEEALGSLRSDIEKRNREEQDFDRFFDREGKPRAKPVNR